MGTTQTSDHYKRVKKPAFVLNEFKQLGIIDFSIKGEDCFLLAENKWCDESKERPQNLIYLVPVFTIDGFWSYRDPYPLFSWTSYPDLKEKLPQRIKKKNDIAYYDKNYFEWAITTDDLQKRYPDFFREYLEKNKGKVA